MKLPAPMLVLQLLVRWMPQPLVQQPARKQAQ